MKRVSVRALPNNKSGCFLAGTALPYTVGGGYFIAGRAVFFNFYLGACGRDRDIWRAPEGVESYGLMAERGDELRFPPTACQSKYAYLHVSGSIQGECADTLARFEELLKFNAQPLHPIPTA